MVVIKFLAGLRLEFEPVRAQISGEGMFLHLLKHMLGFFMLPPLTLLQATFCQSVRKSALFTESYESDRGGISYRG